MTVRLRVGSLSTRKTPFEGVLSQTSFPSAEHAPYLLELLLERKILLLIQAFRLPRQTDLNFQELRCTKRIIDRRGPLLAPVPRRGDHGTDNIERPTFAFGAQGITVALGEMFRRPVYFFV